MEISAYHKIRAELDFSKRPWVIVKHILIDACILGVCVALSWKAPWWLSGLGCGLLLGVLQFRAFSFMHEAVHGIAAASPWLNNTVGRFYGLLCLLPYAFWRRIHLEHHLWTGNLDRDPTMRLFKLYRDGAPPPTRLYEWCWHYGAPYLAWRQQIVFWRHSLHAAREGKGWSPVFSLLFQLGATFLMGALVAWAFGILALVTGILTYLTLVEFINFPHHMGMPQKHGSFRQPAHLQYGHTQTCLYPRWFCSLVLLNFNYHIEHHLYPDLPYAQLPKAHELLRPHLPAEKFCYGRAWMREARKNKTLREMFNCSIDWEGREERKPA